MQSVRFSFETIREALDQRAATTPTGQSNLVALMASSAALALAAATGGVAWAGPALPTGGKVAAGQASLNQSGSTLTVSQSTSKSIIDWSSFSIGAGQTVQFNNGSGATLNRVLTGGPLSQIDGTLSATGSVYLINGSGIVFGKSGVVNVGGSFVASTLNIADTAFLAGGDLTFSGSSQAAIINYGRIGALGGDIVLSAAQVTNAGTLTAANGTVGLLAGTQVLLRDQADLGGKFAVQIGAAGTSVTNSGDIAAAAAELRAENGNVYALAGNTQGVIRATEVSGQGGQIQLTSVGGSVDVAAGATLDASANPAAGGTGSGGHIYVDSASTTFAGAALAKGGAAGGDGGLIETSGTTIDFTGATVNALGPKGAAGTWLIDPQDLTLSSTDAANISSALATANVTITTTGSTPTGGYGTASGSTGNITLNGGSTAISWTAGTTLSLTAAGSIIINSPISLAAGGLTLNAASAININSPIKVSSAGAVNVNYDVSSATNLSFGLSSTGFAGSLSFTGTNSTTGAPKGSLTINGQAYTLLNGLAGSAANDVAGIDTNTAAGGDAGYYALATSLTGTGSSSSPQFSAPLVGSSAIFTGAFEGLGNTITNLTETGISGGLFGTSAGLIRDIGLTGGAVFAQGDNAGELAANLSGGVIADAYATGSVSGAGQNYGGLVGYSSGTITGSYAKGSVSVSAGQHYVALVALNLVTIKGSYAMQSVSGAGQNYGGLAGYSSGTIKGSYATGSVSGSSLVGGLVGENDGAIQNAYATGAVSGTGEVGGLVGENHATIQNAYATGAVSGSTGAGGLVGLNNGGSVANGFYDAYTTGQSSDGGGNGVASELTTAALAGSGVLSALNSGGAVWGNAGNNTTPYLLSNPGPVNLATDASSTPTPYTPILTAAGLSAVNNNTSANYVLANALNLTGTTYTSAVISTFSGVFEGLNNTITGLTITGGSSAYAGLVGNSSGTIRDVGLIGGAVDAVYAGGLVGYQTGGSITNAYATEAVTGGNATGGLVGYMAGGSITNAYATGPVNGSNYAGGLVGYQASGAITGAYATGAVTGEAIGGLVGYQGVGGSITSAYAMGAVNGGNAVGGLIGLSYGHVTDAYATGAVSGGSNPDSLIDFAFGGTYTDLYYNSGTTRTSSHFGIGLTTAQLQGTLPTGFTTAGGWATGTGLYPYLTALFPNGVQAVSGFAYSNAAGTTAAASGTSGAVTVGLTVGGVSYGSATTGSNGYYYFALPAGAISTGGSSVLAYLTTTKSTTLNTLLDAPASSGAAATNFNLLGSTLTETADSSIESLSALNTALGTAAGTTGAAGLGFVNQTITAAAATFTLDVTPVATSAGTLTLLSANTVTDTSTAIGVTSVVLGGGGSFTLSDASNSFANLSTASSTGAITVADTGALAISGLTSAGAVNVSTTGALSTTSAITAAGNLSLTGVGITLGGNLSDGAYTTTLNAGTGAISQSSGVITAATLTGQSTGATTLNDANLITTLGAFTTTGSGSNFSLVNNQALTVTGAVTSGAGVGLTSGSITFGGGGITSSGAITLTGPVTLGADTTLTANNGGTIDFTSTLNGAHALTLTGNAEFDAAVGSATGLTSLLVSGASALKGGTVATTGAQTYTGAATLGADSTLTASKATFASTVDGAHALTITGGAEFDGAVGGTVNLTSLSVSGASTLDGGALATTGAQTYTGAATLGADSVLTASKATFGSTLDGAHALTISGGAEFDGAVGGTANLASLLVSGASTLDGGALATTGAQTYTGAATLGTNTTLTASKATFASTLDGADALTITGGAEFDGAVGGTVNLTSLSVSGASTLDGGALATTGAQTYTGAATLGADSVLTASKATFGSTLDGAHALTISGGAEFDGAVGGTANLASLLVSGASTLDGGALATTGAQTYTGAATLGTNTTLTASKATFASTLDGAYALTITGGAEFDGAVGGTVNLTSLSVSGASTVDGGAAKTTASQTYSGAVTLGANTTLTAGGLITVGSTLDGAYALSLTGGALQFNGVVGGSAAPSSFTATATGGNVTLGSSGIINSSGALLIAADGAFINQDTAVGADALKSGGSGYTVYTQDPTNPTTALPTNTRGGLTGTDYFNDAYNFANATFASAAPSGNHFVYGYAATLTYTANTASKVYGAAIPTLSGTVTGFVNGDTTTTGTATFSTAATASSNVADGPFAINGAGLSTIYNYKFAQASANATAFTITPEAITVTAAGGSKVYDGGVASSLTPTVTNGTLYAGDATLSEIYNSKDVNTATTLTPAELFATGKSVDYTVTNATAAGTITPYTLTAGLTGSVSKTYDSTTTATLGASNYTLTSGLGSDNVTLNGPTSGTYSSANAATNLGVSVTGLTLANNAAGDYQLASTSLSANIGTITAEAITVTAAGGSKVYDGGLASSLTPTVTSGTLYAGDATLSQTYNAKDVNTATTLTPAELFATGKSVDYTVTNTTAAGTITPYTLTAGLTGSVSKTYDSTTTATLGASNYTLTSALGSDTVTLNGPTSGTYSSPNAATNLGVSVTGLTLANNAAGDYQLASASLSANIGTITPEAITINAAAGSKVYDGGLASSLAPTVTSGTLYSGDATLSQTYNSRDVATATTLTPAELFATGKSVDYTVTNTTAAGTITPYTLTAGLTGSVSKTYDSTNVATLGASNYTLTSGFGSDNVTLNGPTSGTYSSANAATNLGVSVTGLTLANNAAGDYQLASTSLSANIGTITPEAITITAAAGSKVYDGGLASSLTPTVTSGTLYAGDATLSQTYNAKDVNTATTLTPAELFATGKSVDYTVTNATAAGTITPYTLTAGLTGSVSKTYDSTSTATLGASNYTLTSGLGSDNVTLNGPTSGTYSSANAATNLGVSVTGLTLANNAAGDYQLASASLSANIGTITPEAITITAAPNTKVYDGGTTASATPTVTGTIYGSDTLSEAYTTANAGTGLTLAPTATLGNASNYAVTYINSTAGTITPAPLAASLIGTVEKTYDGATVATLPPGDVVLTGFIAGQGATVAQTTGTYASVNVGAGIEVSATLDPSNFSANTGTLLANYSLPTTASGAVGVIEAAPSSSTGGVQAGAAAADSSAVNTVAKPFLAFQIGTNSVGLNLGAAAAYTPQVNPQSTGPGTELTPYPDNACFADGRRFKMFGCHW